jgi:hypothetical protein
MHYQTENIRLWTYGQKIAGEINIKAQSDA